METGTDWGLQGMPKLEELSLGGNQIGDGGVIALADAIKPTAEGGKGAMASLDYLSISYNSFGEAAEEQLKAVCSTRSIHNDLDDDSW